MNFINPGPIKKQKPITFKNITSISDFFARVASLVNNNVMELNQSKIFAGLMIIILNIASKYVNIKLSKTVESYLKHTFSRDILVFAISWMGTRDIYIATTITIIFVVLMDFILNENSTFCCLPETFTDYHVSLLETSKNTLTPEEIKQTEMILEKAKTINKQPQSETTS